MENLKVNTSTFNLIIFGIISSIMLGYTITNKIFYLFYIIITIMLFYKLISLRKEINLKKIDHLFIVLVITSLFYIAISAIFKKRYFLVHYFTLYMILFYLYLSFMKYGINYVKIVYKHLTILLNVLSILNLYQVFFHKPILIDYMQLIKYGYYYNFGTSSFRTMSVFGHPIVCSLFFDIAIICNLYLIKSPIKYPLQFILLVNIYSTMSRSSWIALSVAILVYLLLHPKRLLIKQKLTLKKVIYTFLSVMILVIGISFVLLNFDTIYSGIISRFGDSLSTDSTDGSNLQRTATIFLIFNFMVNQDIFHLLFGYGVGTVQSFMLSHPLYIANFATTDNQYMAWLYEFGAFGIIAYIFGLIYLFIKSIINHKNDIIELSLLCLIIISIDMIFFEIIGWLDVSIMLIFIVSCLTFKFDQLSNIQNKKEKKK